MNRAVLTIIIAAILPACEPDTGEPFGSGGATTSESSTSGEPVQGVTGEPASDSSSSSDASTGAATTGGMSSGGTSSGGEGSSSGADDTGSGCAVELVGGAERCACDGVPSDPALCGCVFPAPGACVCDGIVYPEAVCTAACIPGIPCWCAVSPEFCPPL